MAWRMRGWSRDFQYVTLGRSFLLYQARPRMTEDEFVAAG
jgi:hypothetical protein